MVAIIELIKGYKRFYTQNFVKDKELYENLASNGQFPKTLVIACSDSRADPSIVMDTKPGDIFVIRNVANLVPPCEAGTASSYHGTSAALEFAVNNIKVEHIIVLGHGGCAGIHALLHSEISEDEYSFIHSWMQIAKKAKENTLAKTCSEHEKQDICEKEAICDSLNNLMTFPWIKDGVENKTLQLHGWHLSIDDGSLMAWDGASEKFVPIDDFC